MSSEKRLVPFDGLSCQEIWRGSIACKENQMTFGNVETPVAESKYIVRVKGWRCGGLKPAARKRLRQLNCELGLAQGRERQGETEER